MYSMYYEINYYYYLVGVKEVILDVVSILLSVNVLHKYSPRGVFLCVFVIVTYKKEWNKRTSLDNLTVIT